ncbi:MAG: hypothetical protein QXJ14_02770 [Candidatus Aenigmatarchaeota archaeon]
MNNINEICERIEKIEDKIEDMEKKLEFLLDLFAPKNGKLATAYAYFILGNISAIIAIFSVIQWIAKILKK